MDEKTKSEFKSNDPLLLLNNRYEEIVFAINLCLENNYVLPTLMILFTAIDSAGHLYSNNKSGRKRFIEWVNRWLIGDKELPFTAIDLYSARCGILHTLTANSSLVEERKAKKGIYTLKETNEKEAIDALGEGILDEYFIIRINSLVELFLKGFLDFFDNILTNPELRKNVTNKCMSYYSRTTTDEVLEKFNIKNV
ncbi:MAG: hypothetical protein NTZ27_09820 [Ignavibacteriales bacterium]|nr:hypothetical protein [Ignavibacteriales bacterium]